MRPFILALSLLLGAIPAWSGHALGNSVDDLAAAERKAAAGDIQGAMADYERLAQEDPGSADVFARLGGMQLLDQRYEAAIDSFQQAISLGDRGTRAFIGMAMAYLHIGQLGPARAALVQARDRGSDRDDDIEQLIRWIDARATP